MPYLFPIGLGYSSWEWYHPILLKIDMDLLDRVLLSRPGSGKVIVSEA
uniref:Uncharacterized protein n=1 Tax=viral metagenome TaxID=1070528 RepID=A0A6H1ZGL0_9ZZZZ